MKYILILLINITLYANTSYKNEVLVKCIEGVSCVDVLSTYKFNQINKLTNTIYIINLNNTKDAKEVSTLLKTNNRIKFAHPNYIKAKKRR